MDSITTAILVALSTGVVSSATQVGQQVVLDAYNALKSALNNRYGDKSSLVKAISDLEKEPEFKPYQDAFAERVKQFEPYKDSLLKGLAQELLNALEESGAEISGLKTKYHIDVQGGQIGVIGDHAEIKGGIHFDKNDTGS